MRKFAETCEAIAATTKKLQKIAIVAEYLKSRGAEEAAVSAVFLSGRPFPLWQETTLQIGGASLWRLVAELSGKTEAELTSSYRKNGDLGAVASQVLPSRPEQGLSVMQVSQSFSSVATARGPAAKSAIVRALLLQASPLETKYVIKIMTGDLRIGLKESLVEEAISKACGSILAEVQRANMLLGDIGETLRLALAGKLMEAKMRMFHPLGFMLASPIESPEEGLSYFPDAAVEDKYDGIRAQAHISGGEVKLFSRTRDEITESFPELPAALVGLSGEAILDGEIVAWEYPIHKAVTQIVDVVAGEGNENDARNLGRARPFSALQKRLGRKKVSEKFLREIPVAYLAFDVLYSGGQLLLDLPLRERARILDDLVENRRPDGDSTFVNEAGSQGNLNLGHGEVIAQTALLRAPVFKAASPDHLDELFVAAQARGNEGLMIKDVNSLYSPGKRGKSWLKMKRQLATLDVVVTAVEFGHGRRIGVLSDYTFAVWDGERLVNIGKAYSGLTDVEIAEMTKWFLDHTVDDQGFRRTVEPTIVLEVAFNNMMQSERHESGYALRFPRIVRLRPDKSAKEADTIEAARRIYENQSLVRPS